MLMMPQHCCHRQREILPHLPLPELLQFGVLLQPTKRPMFHGLSEVEQWLHGKLGALA